LRLHLLFRAPSGREHASVSVVQQVTLSRPSILRGMPPHCTSASTGEGSRSIPRRSASPLPSTTFGASAGVLEVPTTGRGPMRKHGRATLLTLTPAFPSRPDPCDPACRPDLLSWGCPKIAPPSFRAEESVARVARHRASLREWAAHPLRVPPAWFCTTSADSPPRPCRFVSPCCRSWGSPCFRLVTKRSIPTVRSCPSKPSLRRQRRRGTSPLRG